MKVLFRLVVSKSDKLGFCPVFIDFHFSGKRLRYFTGEKCSVKDWDIKKMRFRRSFEGHLSANEYLESLETRLRIEYRNLMTKGVEPTKDLLRVALKPKSELKAEKSFSQLFADFIEEKKEKLRAVGPYKTALSRILRFEAEHGNIVTYDEETHKKFWSFQRRIGLHPNSIGQTGVKLGAFLSSIGQKIPNYKKEVSTERIFLTVAELEKIVKVELSEHLSRVRDAFIFSCYTGLRYGDLKNLKPVQIKERSGYKIIELIPEKSRSMMSSVKRVEVPLLGSATDILERYSGGFASLPVLSNQKMNEYLKEIAEKAELNENVQTVIYQNGLPIIKIVKKWTLVTTHVARHTFATLSLIKGVPLEILQKVLGHKDLKTTMKYAKIVDEYKNAVILGAWEG